MAMVFKESDRAFAATLADWKPKVNQEMEVRVRLEFEVPLTEELIVELPEPLQRLARAIGRLDDGLTHGTISTAYIQSLAVYEVPESPEPTVLLENVLLNGMHIFRPTPKEGPSEELFLKFHTTVPAGGTFGASLVTWALPHLRNTVFLKPYELQGRLPLDAAA